MTLSAFVPGPRDCAWAWADGRMETLSHAQATRRLDGPLETPPILCHRPSAARRVGEPARAGRDILELFAFVHPARFAVPTPLGLATALGVQTESGHEGEARALLACAEVLLASLPEAAARDPALRPLAAAMVDEGWTWGIAVRAVLNLDAEPVPPLRLARAFAVWERLGEWSETGPEPPPGNQQVTPEEARERLGGLLGADAEIRPGQADFAAAAAQAFRPRRFADAPETVLAEAGTGVGKTAGYIAPASLWTERNAGTVWISTYTRNLQHQIDAELARLYPDPTERARKVVIRKGRENYLCLLNLEEAAGAVTGRLALDNDLTPPAVALGLMARWALATRDGDMTGGDFPAWLPDLLGRRRSLGLADRRGECVYSACPHYRKCFIERSVRRGRRASIVIANHALVMIQAALGGEGGAPPTRYVFDEGHHLFDAADGAFSAHLSGREAHDLRRWLRGSETAARRSRARGLRRRLDDLIVDDLEASGLVDDALAAAACLPEDGWVQRLGGALGGPRGETETLLALARAHGFARVARRDGPYDLEAEMTDPDPALIEAARALDQALGRLARPLMALVERLESRLDDEAETLDTPTRLRVEAMARGITRRAGMQIEAWRGMLQRLTDSVPEDPSLVDWISIERIDGREVDVGLNRHWVDPTRPLADFVLRPAHGVLVTSATLRDGAGDPERDWAVAEARTGAFWLPEPAARAAAPSPFDYAARTRVLIVTDVRKDDMRAVAAAYRALFLASGGGALGLFTAIGRLRAVHQRLAGPLDEVGLRLLAQHVDGMNIATLIEIFRAEVESCLLGTDAVRDGVDVPGRSLRLIVFDRVPWPRPDILHRARREDHAARTGDKRGYDDLIARLRLKQAFGRLIRRAEDSGVFVLLDPMMPSRLFGAFPEGTPVERVGLAEAVSVTRGFLGVDPDAAAPTERARPGTAASSH